MVVSGRVSDRVSDESEGRLGRRLRGRLLAGMASLRLYKRIVYCSYQNQPFLYQNQSFPTLIYIHFFRYGLQREFGRKSTPKYASPCVFSYPSSLIYQTQYSANSKSFIWTDESAMHRSGHQRVFVTRRPYERFHPHCLRPRFRDTPHTMIWACFCGC